MKFSTIGFISERTSIANAYRERGFLAGTKKGRFNLIAKTAYFKAESRGFIPGHELDDWLAAETEVDGAGEKS